MAFTLHFTLHCALTVLFLSLLFLTVPYCSLLFLYKEPFTARCCPFTARLDMAKEQGLRVHSLSLYSVWLAFRLGGHVGMLDKPPDSLNWKAGKPVYTTAHLHYTALSLLLYTPALKLPPPALWPFQNLGAAPMYSPMATIVHQTHITLHKCIVLMVAKCHTCCETLRQRVHSVEYISLPNL